jgi:hypothetical protein
MELSVTEGSRSAGATMLSQMYGFTGDAAQFTVQHIDTLKQADSILANRCGQVLEAANVGFGVGTDTALLLIGVGQALLGNPLSGGIVASGGNPLIMTCAAIGAVHYGWNAMSDQEREVLLNTVGAAFRVGVEFIRSVARFSIEMIQALLSKGNFDEMKKMVADAAAAFGRHLSDITKALSDKVREGAQ